MHLAGRGRQRRRRVGAAGAEHHDRPRYLGHRARLRQDGRRRRVRRHLCAGRGRFQSRRDQLPQLDGTAGGSGRRGRDLPRSAHEDLHRSRRHEGAVPEESRLAEEADERVGRRVELLPAHAPEREGQGDQSLRAVDGAQLQRRKHRRRHRARQPDGAREILRTRAQDPNGLRLRASGVSAGQGS